MQLQRLLQMFRRGFKRIEMPKFFEHDTICFALFSKEKF